MPCYSQRATTLVLKATNRSILLKAIEALEWSFDITREGLRVRTSRGDVMMIDGENVSVRVGQEALVQELKMEYAKENVRAAAKAGGWELSRFTWNSEGDLESEMVRESL